MFASFSDATSRATSLLGQIGLGGSIQGPVRSQLQYLSVKPADYSLFNMMLFIVLIWPDLARPQMRLIHSKYKGAYI